LTSQCFCCFADATTTQGSAATTFPVGNTCCGATAATTCNPWTYLTSSSDTCICSYIPRAQLTPTSWYYYFGFVNENVICSNYIRCSLVSYAAAYGVGTRMANTYGAYGGSSMPIRAIRICGYIYNCTSNTNVYCWCARTYCYNFSSYYYTFLCQCTLAPGGYWNYDMTVGQCCAEGLRTNSTQGLPLYSLMLCADYCGTSGTYGVVCNNIAYCWNRGQDSCTGPGIGTGF